MRKFYLQLRVVLIYVLQCEKRPFRPKTSHGQPSSWFNNDCLSNLVVSRHLHTNSIYYSECLWSWSALTVGVSPVVPETDINSAFGVELDPLRLQRQSFIVACVRVAVDQHRLRTLVAIFVMEHHHAVYHLSLTALHFELTNRSHQG